MFLNENPTKERILLLLKKKGLLSIEELSSQLGITPMGIRQHLLSLERKGLVEYVSKRYGIGRPVFIYRLTERADELFPKAYHEFIISAFKDIEENESRGKIEDIFRWRKERLLKEYKEALSDKKSLHDRVYGVKGILESKGYLVELNGDGNSYILRQFNCLISKVASVFREACGYELQMYRDLLRKDVMRQECISEGGASCTYVIPKAPLRL
jgi:predicted ArsR family transcriptional regulator